MLPKSDPPLIDPQFLKKPKSPDYSDHRKTTYFTFFSTHPRTWLFFTILCLQLFLLYMVLSLPVSFSFRHFSNPHVPNTTTTTIVSNATTTNTTTTTKATTTTTTTKTIEKDELCDLGKVYVYDLPAMFNTELSEKCDDLNPWHSRCDALSNDGFGREASKDVAGVVPDNLTSSWFWTDQFASEIIFHNRILTHKCRTLNPESASAFYIPFYAGLAVGKYLWSSNYTFRDRDFHCQMMLKWVQDQPYWGRSNGWDHFIMLGRISWDFRRSKDEDWGSSFIHMPAMKNVTRLLIERNPWDYFDVGVPYPTGFHPSTESELSEWQGYVRTRTRKTLFSFAGATRGAIKNDFRGLLLRHCFNESDACRVVDCGKPETRCSNGSSAILETFLDSEFCLQPRGDSFTRRSIFDCMVAGAIPVFFWHRTAYYQYEWFLPGETKSYSVYIDRREVNNGTSSIRGVLENIDKEEVKRMRNKVIDYIPKFVYARGNASLKGFRDAFDVAIDGVLGRFRELRKMRERKGTPIRKLKEG